MLRKKAPRDTDVTGERGVSGRAEPQGGDRSTTGEVSGLGKEMLSAASDR